MISPGNVNLLGARADYNDEAVLLVAIDCYVTMAIKLRGDDQGILRALDLDASAEFSLMELDKRCDLRRGLLPDRELYSTVVNIKNWSTGGNRCAAVCLNLIREYWQVTECDNMFPLCGVTLGENSCFNRDGGIYFL